MKEPLRYVFMYGTLADSETLRRLPYCGAVFYDIIGDFHGSFFNIIFQKNPPAIIVFTMYAGGRRSMTSSGIFTSNYKWLLSLYHSSLDISATLQSPLQTILHLYKAILRFPNDYRPVLRTGDIIISLILRCIAPSPLLHTIL